ncbi:MAG TPA: SUMF1/EgtB/PvdO family nonheme iron enzyme [Bryobacteraceae bacterium]|nr:SUMF1/EgtB/PvdO family nonheme iron enzyme [Bryobacteraceae bacterium]
MKLKSKWGVVALTLSIGVTTATNALAQRDLILERGNHIALVIGNDAYPKGPLKNAVNDARSMSGALQEVGFQVELLINGDLRQMDRAVDKFASRLGSGDVAVLYYAGHGVQVDGENYLIPVDYAGRDEADIRYQSRSASWILEKMDKTGARLKIVILDACRSNPFRVSRAMGGGLAQMQGGRGSFIAFATAAGKVASDDPAGSNGLFTTHLLQALKQPGLSLDAVFNRVRVEVDRASGGEQLPYIYSGVIGEFYFRPTTAHTVTSAAPAPPELPVKGNAPPPVTPPQIQVNPIDGLRYVLIPPGSYRMGCSEGDEHCRQDEMPPHPVTISRGFWLGQTEVTRIAFSKFSRDTGARDPTEESYREQKENLRSAHGRLSDDAIQAFIAVLDDEERAGTRIPVVHVSWSEASAYCKWVGGRLPSEAEWEYGARGGSTASRYGPAEEVAWHRAQMGNNPGPRDAGIKLANAFMLHDTLGNVWEWVADWYEAGYYRESPVVDPKGPEAGDAMVVRGGSIQSRADSDLRVSARGQRTPGTRNVTTGFRCVWAHGAPFP